MRRQQLALMMAIAALGLVAAPAVGREEERAPRPQPKRPDPDAGPRRVWSPPGGNTRERIRRMRQQLRAEAKAGRS